MRLLKTHSHTSERSGYEARKNAKKVIEGIAVTIIRQTTRQKPAAYRQCGGGGETKKGEVKNTGAKTRETNIKTLPQATIVAGGRDKRRKPTRKELWHNPQSREGGEVRS